MRKKKKLFYEKNDTTRRKAVMSMQFWNLSITIIFQPLNLDIDEVLVFIGLGFLVVES